MKSVSYAMCLLSCHYDHPNTILLFIFKLHLKKVCSADSFLLLKRWKALYTALLRSYHNILVRLKSLCSQVHFLGAWPESRVHGWLYDPTSPNHHLPPPCLTGGMKCLCWYALLCLCKMCIMATHLPFGPLWWWLINSLIWLGPGCNLWLWNF